MDIFKPVYYLVLSIRRSRMRYLGHILRVDQNHLVRRTPSAYVHRAVSAGSLLEDCEAMPFEQLACFSRDRKSMAHINN